MNVLLVYLVTNKEPYYVYPLGMSFVARVLHDAGYKVKQVSLFSTPSSAKKLYYILKYYRPDIVGLSLRNISNQNYWDRRLKKYCISRIREVVRIIRTATKAFIVIGGAGFSIDPCYILNKTKVDYGIVGEGEKAFVKLVNNLSRKNFPKRRCLKAQKKIDGKDIVYPLYDREMLRFYSKRNYLIPVQTKRGCEFRCLYCINPIIDGDKFRYLSPVKVVDVVEELIVKYKVGSIFFSDSVFNDTKENFMHVVNEMRKRRIFVPWAANIRPKGLDEKKIILMRSTGFFAAEMASDTTNNYLLELLNKNFTYDDIINTNILLKKYGIATVNYFMFGLPGENKEMVINGIEKIKKIPFGLGVISIGFEMTASPFLSHKKLKNKMNEVFYISRYLDKKWLENILENNFANKKKYVFIKYRSKINRDYWDRVVFDTYVMKKLFRLGVIR